MCKAIKSVFIVVRPLAKMESIKVLEYMLDNSEIYKHKTYMKIYLLILVNKNYIISSPKYLSTTVA